MQWLRGVIVDADYQAVGVDLVVQSAREDLGLDLDESRRLFIWATWVGGEFKSDGEHVTLR